jgi:hypothetical protein
MHVLGDRDVGDVVSEEGEFRLDAPAAPGGIVPSHLADQVANLGGELRAADCPRPGPPPPVEPEALAVPGEDGGRLHDDEAGAPAGPHAGQPDPEDPVPPRQAWSAHRPLQNQELMAERHVLEGDDRRSEEPGT